MSRKSLTFVFSLYLAACNGGGGSGAVPVVPNVDTPKITTPEPPALACLRSHPFISEFDSLIEDQERYSYNSFDGDEPPLPPNLYRDAPSASGLPKPQATGSIACHSNTRYRSGVSRVDITGPWAGRSRAGVEAPIDLLNGLNQRVYARAFVIGEDCTGSSVVLVNADLGFMHRSVRDGVIRKLAAAPQTAAIDPNSLLLTATHTHNFSGGYSHDLMFSALHGGHKEDVLDEIVSGIAEAITQAWLMHEQATPGELTLALNELLHTNANRHASGYRQNTEAERNRYLDIHGNEQLTNVLATQLNLLGDDGQMKGLLNWFAVHPTAALMGTLAHGDSKGYAALTLERALGDSGAQDFVAGFLQSDEGDVVPIRYIDNENPGEPRLPPLLTAVLGEDVAAEQANVALSGTRQAENALQLLTQTEQRAISGSIDYRTRFMDFSEQRVTDPVILASLQHPPELDSEIKRTCDPVYGVSSVGKEVFGKYQSCPSAASVPLEEFLNDVSSGELQRSGGDIAKIALCVVGGVDLSAVGGPDYSCQAEKPYLFGTGEQGPAYTQENIPLQILRIGNFAVIALPWEITTMAGRRIRETVLDELKVIGVDYVVIAGLANEYVQYLTTREEYARQGYEAASNHFGPWTLAAARQALRGIALDMVAGEAPYPAEPLDTRGPRVPNVLVADSVITDIPTRAGFAEPIVDIKAHYLTGERLRFSYQGGFPNHDTYRNGHYFEIQRQLPDGSWSSWITDADPETILHWRGNPPVPLLASAESILEIDWFIGWDTPPGSYRIVYRTTTREIPGSKALTAYEAATAVFQINSSLAAQGEKIVCPSGRLSL